MLKNIRNVSVSPLFFAGLAVMVWVDSAGYMLTLLLTAVLHEMGHLAAFCAFRIPIAEIRFELFGIAILPEKSRLIPNKTMLICLLAGPCVNLLLFGSGVILGQFFDLTGAIRLFVTANLILSLFNLLPMMPLDGGRLLALLLGRLLGATRAENGMRIFSGLFGIGLLILGVILMREAESSFVYLIAAGIILGRMLLMLLNNFWKGTENEKKSDRAVRRKAKNQ